MTNNYEDVQQVVYINTNIVTGCKHCTYPTGGEKFAESINHYIDKHDYKLLHVGTETSRDPEGNLWHHTVAVLGK